MSVPASNSNSYYCQHAESEAIEGGFRPKKAPPRLTAKGRRQLAVETGKWDKLAGATAQILRPVEHEGI
jgi:hypothetical protein